MVAPELQKVAARQAGRAIVARVNTDELQDLGQRFGIRSIPTLAVFAGGREVTRSAGARPAEDIERLIEQATSVHRQAQPPRAETPGTGRAAAWSNISAMTRSVLVLSAFVAIAAVSAQTPSRAPFDLEEATIADLQQRMTSGRESARSIAEKYLARIEAVDRGGPAAAQRHRNQSRGARPSRIGSTRSARRAARAVRCTASRFS